MIDIFEVNEDEYKAFKRRIQKRIKSFTEFDEELRIDPLIINNMRNSVSEKVFYGSDSEDSDFELLKFEKLMFRQIKKATKEEFPDADVAAMKKYVRYLRRYIECFGDNPLKEDTSDLEEEEMKESEF